MRCMPSSTASGHAQIKAFTTARPMLRLSVAVLDGTSHAHRRHVDSPKQPWPQLAKASVCCPTSVTCQALHIHSRAVPETPPEWLPPSEPGTPASPPEFEPPGEPGTTVRPPPEFIPPEQNPTETPGRSDRPMRPVRPEEEPKVPDPDTPFADPLRSPERRKEISEPARESPRRPDTEDDTEEEVRPEQV